jgi:pilus assembly protein CpaC
MNMFSKIKTLGAVLSVTTCLVSFDVLADAINIPVGRSELVTVSDDMVEVIVANPDVADAYVHDKRFLTVIGKAVGKTDVRVIGDDGVLRDIDVSVSYDLPAMRKALSEFLPNENIAVEMLNTNVVLTGRVSGSTVAEQATDIVREFLNPAAYLRSGAPTVNAAAANPLIATNTEDSRVINMLEITSGQQVMLRVRVGEIRKTALKNMGINLQATKVGGTSLFGLGTGAGIAGLVDGSGVPLGSFEIPVGDGGNLASPQRGYAVLRKLLPGGDSISGMLEALERDNLFKLLAEPNLVSLSGEEAQFLVGGEFPIPVPNLNGIGIEYKPFGVSVKFTPFVLSENRIRIAVAPEVSEINNDSALVLDNFSVPSLSTRRAQSVVELAPGESFMIAGLIRDQLSSKLDTMPGIKEVPILGALFSSVSFQREESELVLAVTPNLVDPLVSGDVRLPTDNFKPASVMETFFYGAMSSLQGNVDRVSQTPTTEGPVGFMVD